MVVESTSNGIADTCLERIEHDLEKWHREKTEYVSTQEETLCKQAEHHQSIRSRAEACKKLGKRGAEDGPPLADTMLKSMSIGTLERIVKSGKQDPEVSEAACIALQNLAAHRRPSTTTTILEQVTKRDNCSVRLQEAAFVALNHIKSVIKTEEETGCNRCIRCLQKTIQKNIEALSTIIQTKHQQERESSGERREIQNQFDLARARNQMRQCDAKELIQRAENKLEVFKKKADDLRNNETTQHQHLSDAKKKRIAALRETKSLSGCISESDTKLAALEAKLKATDDVKKVEQICESMRDLVEQRKDSTKQLLTTKQLLREKLNKHLGGSHKIQEALGITLEVMESADQSALEEIEREFASNARKKEILAELQASMDKDVEGIAKEAEDLRRQNTESETEESQLKAQIDTKSQELDHLRIEIERLKEAKLRLEDMCSPSKSKNLVSPSEVYAIMEEAVQVQRPRSKSSFDRVEGNVQEIEQQHLHLPLQRPRSQSSFDRAEQVVQKQLHVPSVQDADNKAAAISSTKNQIAVPVIETVEKIVQLPTVKVIQVSQDLKANAMVEPQPACTEEYAIPDFHEPSPTHQLPTTTVSQGSAILDFQKPPPMSPQPPTPTASGGYATVLLQPPQASPQASPTSPASQCSTPASQCSTPASTGGYDLPELQASSTDRRQDPRGPEKWQELVQPTIIDEDTVLPTPSQEYIQIRTEGIESQTGIYYVFLDMNDGYTTRAGIAAIPDEWLPVRNEYYTTQHLRLLKYVSNTLISKRKIVAGAKLQLCLGFAIDQEGRLKRNSCANLIATGARELPRLVAEQLIVILAKYNLCDDDISYRSDARRSTC